MSDHNHEFCRALLRLTLLDVRKRFTSEEMKRAWAWGGGRSDGYRFYEFHGPNGEYLYNLKNADCKWSALAAGWRQLLDSTEDNEEEKHHAESSPHVGQK